MLTGSCLCGDIAFAIDGPIETMAHCHCSMCRKFHGSAFATFGTTAPEHFNWVRGAQRIRSYRSSAQGYRPFCPRCGSAVPMHGEDLPFAVVPMGNVAEDPGTRPQLHFFTSSMAPWHSIVDDLPRHDEYPPEFGPAPISVERPARQPQTPGATAGSCLCGAVAFEFDDPPLRMYNCHCSRCRRAVSAAYQTVIRVRRSGFRWLAGAELTVKYRHPGTMFHCAFCRICGSRVPWAREATQFVVPAGCLDSDPGQGPTDNIFSDSRAPWTELDSSLETWPGAASWYSPPPEPAQ